MSNQSTNQQPTKVERLGELIKDMNARDDGEDPVVIDVCRWLEWTYVFLESRRLYHKKSTLRKSILEKMAKELLAPDELLSVEAEAERQLVIIEAREFGGRPEADEIHKIPDVNKLLVKLEKEEELE